MRWASRFNRVSALLLSCLGLAACGSPRQRADLAESIAAPAGLVRADVAGGAFTLATWSRLSDPRAPLTVYIGGDGLAWLTPTEVSPDPTPTDPVALRLAALDPSPNVVYIARPCQFSPPAGAVACDPAYWTDRIFAPPVIASVNAVIGDFATRTSGRIRLVGYSGGGAVAILIAGLRGDVLDLRTVAGNIDTAAFVRLHQVTPYTESLDPADDAARLKTLPQIHFVGGADTVVPAPIAAAYARRMGSSRCLTVTNLPGIGHDHGWAAAWPRLLADKPACTP